jgi:catechol 2,3-dioxygenase-like lactoylglutathione lyase family enzyme
LVDDLQRSITYYCERLGFALEFTYESFYASVVRDGCAIHLKHGPAAPQERERRKNDEHLDAYVTVTGVSELFAELKRRGAVLLKPLENRQWGCQDFYVEDPDGYVLCFSERQRS